MKVNVLLGDAAQVDAGGKIHVLGLGWTRTTSPTGPMAVVVLLELGDAPEVNRSHDATIVLVDERGERVDLSRFGVPAGGFTVSIDRKPDGVADGPIIAPIVLQTGPLPLEGDRKYRWSVSVDGESEPSWYAAFATNPVGVDSDQLAVVLGEDG
ncbi:hypothetical protein [Amycolatopsis sp. NPDC051071]|uniref:DUF6941 family protein n=1 Tax=Amycolatopsis sp. NPDC051071 TaxID=3154637 RepID=UPI00342B3F9F